MTKMMRLLMLAISLPLAACATVGGKFESDLTWIEKGETTKSEVQRILGEPFAVGHSGERPTWTYGYYRYSLFGETYTKELKFYWNSDGTVDDYSFNSSFPDDTKAAQSAG